MVSGTVRRYGLSGVGGTFFEELCHCGGELWEPMLELQGRRVFSWLPSDQDVELLAPPALYLLGHCHFFCHDDNKLNIWICTLPPIKCCPLSEQFWSCYIFITLKLKTKSIKKITLERNPLNLLNMVKHLYISIVLIIIKVFILPFTETLWMETKYNLCPSQLSLNALTNPY